MRIGGGSSASAQQAEAARQREAARKAAEAAENARKAAADANRKAADAAEKVKSTKSEITQAKSDLDRANDQLDRGARLSPEAREKIVSKAESAREKLTKLEKALPGLEKDAARLHGEALKASAKALTEEKEANTEAKAAGKKEPYAFANQVKDVFDAGSLSVKAQEKLFGEKGVVSPQEAGKADAARVAAATRGGVENGAQMLEKQLESNKDPAYRKALIEASRPSIEEMGRQLSLDGGRPGEDTMKAALGSLARAGELGGRDGARVLADAFASKVPDHDLDIDDGDRLGGALKDVISSKNGALFGAELAHSLRKAGKGEAAEEVSKLTREALQDARKDFEAAKKKVDSLNGELGNYIAGFGPAMTKDQKAKAIESFRERHKEDYEKWEAAGDTYSSMLEGAAAASEHPLPKQSDGVFSQTETEGHALREEAKKASELLPELGKTQAGLEKIAQAVEQQGDGMKTFLDAAKNVTEGMAHPKGYIDQLSPTVVKATALKAVELGAQGKTGEMKKLMAGLEASSGLLGVDREELKAMTSLLSEFKPSMTEAQLQNLGSHIQEEVEDMAVRAGLDPEGTTAQSLKGMAVAMGAVSTFQGIKDWSKADFTDRVQTLGNAVNLGGDGGALALEVFNKAEKLPNVAKFLKVAGPAGSVVSALGEGLSAVNAFKEGKYFESAASGSMALGAALMAVPMGVTQVLGGALVVGGAITKFALGKGEEHADEDDLKAFLEGGGVSPEVADAINDLNGDRQNYGDVLTETALALNSNPYDLLKHMGTWRDDQIQSFQQVLEWFGDRDEPEQSGTVLASMLRQADLVPPPPTRYNGPT